MWKDCSLDPSSCSEYLAGIIYDSVITCNEIIEEKKTIPTYFNERKATCKTQNFSILFKFLLITVVLVIVSIFCYLIKTKIFITILHNMYQVKVILYWQHKLKISARFKNIDKKIHIVLFLMISFIKKILIQ